MKYLFIGDIHNNCELMEKICDYATYNNYHMVFVGDYVDSLERDPEDGVKCLDLVLKYSDDHTFLIGNHDLSYMFPQYHECQGYNNRYAYEYKKRLEKSDLQFSFSIDNILVTHAGLHKNMLPMKYIYNGNVDAHVIHSYIETNTMNILSPLLQNGRARGGKQKYGGITWCDFYEEFEGIIGIRQIFGHTKTRDTKEVKLDKKVQSKNELDEIKKEHEVNGFFYARANMLRNILYFVRAKGITKKREGEEITGINIDNLEYGFKELLVYDDDTKQLTILKEFAEYGNDL